MPKQIIWYNKTA